MVCRVLKESEVLHSYTNYIVCRAISSITRIIEGNLLGTLFLVFYGISYFLVQSLDFYKKQSFTTHALHMFPLKRG